MIPFLIAAYLGRPEVLVCAVYQEAERQGLDPIVVCAQTEVESGFNQFAQSSTGDHGLLQLSERYYGKIPDVKTHVWKALWVYRKNLVRERGNVVFALSRYNTGRVCKVGRAYARKVLTLAERIKKAVIVQKYLSPFPYTKVGRKDRWYGFVWEWAPRRKIGRTKSYTST